MNDKSQYCGVSDGKTMEINGSLRYFKDYYGSTVVNVQKHEGTAMILHLNLMVVP